MKPRSTREMTPARRQPRVFSSYDSRCTEQSSIVIFFFLLIFVLVSRYDDTPEKKKEKKGKSIVDSRARALSLVSNKYEYIHTHTHARVEICPSVPAVSLHNSYSSNYVS